MAGYPNGVYKAEFPTINPNRVYEAEFVENGNNSNFVNKDPDIIDAEFEEVDTDAVSVTPEGKRLTSGKSPNADKITLYSKKAPLINKYVNHTRESVLDTLTNRLGGGVLIDTSA